MNNSDQTTPYSAKASAVFCIPLTIMLSVGTGDVLTQQVCKLREGGNRYDHPSSDNSKRPSLHGIVTPADDIAYIRSVLKTSVTDLASCIGVSRQSLYNWKSGSNIKFQHLTKLAQLKAAANALLAEKISGSPLFLERRLPGGKTLLQTIAEGGDGHATAMMLVDALRNEAVKRSSLDDRFAARLAGAPKSSDYGVPAFDERG